MMIVYNLSSYILVDIISTIPRHLEMLLIYSYNSISCRLLVANVCSYTLELSELDWSGLIEAYLGYS